MARRPKPFFHRGWWCSNAGGTHTKLAKGQENRAAAEGVLLDLLKQLRDAPQSKPVPLMTVRELGDKFLDWVELHRAKDTWQGAFIRDGGIDQPTVTLASSGLCRDLIRVTVSPLRSAFAPLRLPNITAL